MLANTNILPHNMVMSNKNISRRHNSGEKQIPSINIIEKERANNMVVYPEGTFHILPVQTVSDQQN